MRVGLLLGAVALSGVGAAQEAAPTRPTVVELFTSQGCSSCPPAEAVLGELSGRADVIALAYHVDYWDSGSWRDHYAISDAVRRQSLYTHTLQLPSAFTPQAVVDGRSSLVGSDRRRILASLGDTAESIPVQLEVRDGALHVRISGHPSAQTCDINLAAYLSRSSTAVGGGENSGRNLTEYNIVRRFIRLGTWNGTAQTLAVPLSSLPADADHVAVFVQRADQGRMAGAAALALR